MSEGEAAAVSYLTTAASYFYPKLKMLSAKNNRPAALQHRRQQGKEEEEQVLGEVGCALSLQFRSVAGTITSGSSKKQAESPMPFAIRK